MTDYAPTTWANQPATSSPLNALALNKMEAQLDLVSDYVRQAPAKRARVATTANITLSGTQTIDAVAVTTGNRVLVKNQTTGSQNGLYVVAAGSWTRAPDAEDGTELTGGMLVAVAEGTSNGGQTFRLTNNGSITIGSTNLTFANTAAATTGYTTDGSTPLKFSGFLAAASGNQNAAWQNAINALFANTAFNISLDLEGATVTITQPGIIPTTGTGGIKSIVNGEILAGAGFTGGDFMLLGQNIVFSYTMRLVNVTMNGQSNASWIKWDKGNFVITACQFKNNKAGTAGDTGRLGTMYNRAGLFCSDGGAGSNADSGFWIDNCWFSTDDGPVDPTSRTRIGIVSQTGDNKIGGGTTMSYFRHSIIFEAPGVQVNGFHPFQGKTPVGADMTNHTASIKFCGGRAGAQVSNLYLGKSFMEISNEANTNQRELGEICITNMRAFMQNGEAGAGHIVVRDYSGGAAGVATVTDITLMNSKFINGGTTQTKPTDLYNPGQFNRGGNKGITMQGNTFETTGWGGSPTQDVWPQANPCTLKKTFSAGTSHVFDYSPSGGNYFPFGSYVKSLVSAVGHTTNSTNSVLQEGVLGNSTVDVTTGSSWAGDIVATSTCNSSFGSGFVDG